ncbi:DMT family transporter [Runella sp.]|uniref:DMT family transporter n=1 Tax=Runella sp. TaxID=1960881 RepID=UPI003D14C5C9
MNDSSKSPAQAWILLLLVALTWGTSFILIKKSLLTFSVTEVAAGRLFLASLFFVPIMVASRRQIPRDRFPYILVSALTGYIIPAFLFALAGTKLNSSLSGMLNSLSPLCTLVIGVLFFAQPRRPLQIVGILLGLLGSCFLIFSKGAGTLNVADPYAFLILTATLLYGININTISKHLSHLPSLAMTAWTFAFTGPISFIILFTTDFFPKITAVENIQPSATLLALGVIGSGLASVMFNRIVQLASGLFAASVTYLIPIVAISWGIFDGERISFQQYVGMGIILAGIYLVNRRERVTPDPVKS